MGEPVAVCDIAVPLRLHSNAVDRIAIAEGAAKLDDDLMIISRQIQDGHCVPMRTRYHTFQVPTHLDFAIGQTCAPSVQLHKFRAMRDIPVNFGVDAKPRE